MHFTTTHDEALLVSFDAPSHHPSICGLWSPSGESLPPHSNVSLQLDCHPCFLLHPSIVAAFHLLLPPLFPISSLFYPFLFVILPVCGNVMVVVIIVHCCVIFPSAASLVLYSMDAQGSDTSICKYYVVLSMPWLHDEKGICRSRSGSDKLMTTHKLVFVCVRHAEVCNLQQTPHTLLMIDGMSEGSWEGDGKPWNVELGVMCQTMTVLSREMEVLSSTTVSFCTPWDNFHYRECQTHYSGFV